jgi:hypothetical protein
MKWSFNIHYRSFNIKEEELMFIPQDEKEPININKVFSCLENKLKLWKKS